MKKFISIFILSIVLLFGLTACGANQGGNGISELSGNEENQGKALKIVTTIFPEYDWVKEILGENINKAELTMLLDDGVDIHSYQPTAEDILKIATCDIFIYVGGESDEWVKDALAEAKNKDMVVINLLETLGDKVKEEEIAEGMESEEEGEEGKENEEELDEHVWLSMKNSAILVDNIAKQIGQKDKENADLYLNNAKKYIEELNKLDAEYKKAVEDSKVKTLLFGDRFPFRYLVDDYGLSYYAAFAGCSAETEASFETVVFLAKKVDELSLKSILTIDNENQKIAETIRDNTKEKNQKILSMDSMQSTTSKDVEAGKSYLSIMAQNLEILKEALQISESSSASEAKEGI